MLDTSTQRVTAGFQESVLNGSEMTRWKKISRNKNAREGIQLAHPLSRVQSLVVATALGCQCAPVQKTRMAVAKSS